MKKTFRASLVAVALGVSTITVPAAFAQEPTTSAAANQSGDRSIAEADAAVKDKEQALAAAKQEAASAKAAAESAAAAATEAQDKVDAAKQEEAAAAKPIADLKAAQAKSDAAQKTVEDLRAAEIVQEERLYTAMVELEAAKERSRNAINHVDVRKATADVLKWTNEHLAAIKDLIAAQEATNAARPAAETALALSLIHI